MDQTLSDLSTAVGDELQQQNCMLACAESCTGGWAAQIVTATPGCSAWFERGFITYSNTAKQEMLGVNAATLSAHGAVSEAVAREMAVGALAHSQAQVALSITGIAGPGGAIPPSPGSSGKPVGTVCFAWCRLNAQVISTTRHFEGSREEVRKQASIHALQGLLDLLDDAKTVP